MSLSVTAAVAREGRDEFSVEPLQLEDPRRDEVLVRFTAAGLCATDLDAAQGMLPTPRPVVLGHEGVGVVEAIGESVVGIAPGDRVVCSLDSCGVCANCLRGQPAYCPSHVALNFGASRADGSVGFLDAEERRVHDHFFGQSSFANFGLTHARSLVVVDDDLPAEVLAPLGCGVVTGVGAVWNVLRAQPGDTVAVFGAGTVGLSAIMAARVAGAARIIAVDLHRTRLDLALSLGATDVVDAAEVDSVDAVLELTGGLGVDFSVESTGVATVMTSAVAVLAPLGTASILGVVGLEADLRTNAFELLKGRSLAGSVMGHQAPSLLIPRIIDLHRQGRFPINRLVSTFELKDINDAVEASRAGNVVKAILQHVH